MEELDDGRIESSDYYKLMLRQDWKSQSKRLVVAVERFFLDFRVDRNCGIEGHDAYDIAQAAIFDVCSGKPGYVWSPQKGASLQTFLTNVAFFKVLDLVKKCNFHKSILQELFAEIDPTADRSIEKALFEKELVDQIGSFFHNDEAVLTVLDALHRGYSRKEILNELEISASVYDNALRRVKYWVRGKQYSRTG